MPIKNGDFIRLEFTSIVKETGDIFDTTNEEIAKEADVFSEKKDYGPIPIIVGGSHLLKVIDEAVIGMEEGESKKIVVTPEKGFGERDPSLIQLVPMKDFKKQGMKPFAGMIISLEGHQGKVLTVSGGRVRVDFNHFLAGKILEYDLVINEIIEDDEEKIKSMIQLHYSYPTMDIDKTELKIDGDKLTIKLDEVTKYDHKSYMDITLARFRIAKDIWENMDFEKVEFKDEFEKQDEEEEISEEEEKIELLKKVTNEISKKAANEEFSEEVANEELNDDVINEEFSEEVANEELNDDVINEEFSEEVASEELSYNVANEESKD